MRKSRKNILFIMGDQLTASFLPFYGHRIVKAPFLSALARSSVVFENAYCNFPLCAPSRFSLLSGRLPSRIGAYDNAAEFSASTPTFLHHLRLAGYKTCLSGKMHFVGPDQLHGFEERLTTEIYPSDFSWCPDWLEERLAYEWTHSYKIVSESGVCTRGLQLDYDENVAFHAEQKIYDYARSRDDKPFFLMVSFTHPHNPYVITRTYWDRYERDEIDMPSVPYIPEESCDAHSQRLYKQFGLKRDDVSEDDIRTTRHAYYSMISYLDDKVGQLLHALEMAGLVDDTIIIFTTDHGDMMGERGLFYKMSFFEGAARVPLLICDPERPVGRRCQKIVSLVDVAPTLVSLAGGSTAGFAELLEGNNLVDIMGSDDADWPDTVYGEYLAEGALAPCLMIRRGRHKFIYSVPDPIQLYDLTTDPNELNNLAEDANYKSVLDEMMIELFRVWNPDSLKDQVVDSQRRRALITEALQHGQRHTWDYEPRVDASRQYVRSGGETKPSSSLNYIKGGLS